MDRPQLVRAMTDAYLVRRRKGGAFDDTAAIQAYWEVEPRMSAAQSQAFAAAGRGNSVAGWKVELRDQLARRERVSGSTQHLSGQRLSGGTAP